MPSSVSYRLERSLMEYLYHHFIFISSLFVSVAAHAEPGQGGPDDGRHLRGAPGQLQPAAGQRQQASQGHQQLHQMRQRYAGRQRRQVADMAQVSSSSLPSRSAHNPPSSLARSLGRIAEKGLMDGLTGSDVADKLCEARSLAQTPQRRCVAGRIE